MAASSGSRSEPVSMNSSFLVYWVFPILLIACFSRRMVDETYANTIEITDPLPPKPNHRTPQPTPPSRPVPPKPTNTDRSQWPTSYRTVVEDIESKRRYIPGYHSVPPPPPPRPPSDPLRAKFQKHIAQLQADSRQHPQNMYRAIAAAEAMRLYELQFHEGGRYEAQAISWYERILAQATSQRQSLVERNVPTRHAHVNVADEVTLEFTEKSVDGLVCGLATALGKLLFMANMFARAVATYTQCLDTIEPYYLDALNARGSARIVLGEYEAAATDFWDTIRRDDQFYFIDAFTGLARVLEARKGSDWTEFVREIERRTKRITDPAQLHRLHHALFTYHETQTKNYDQAFVELERAHDYKLSTIDPWKAGSEAFKAQQTRAIFRAGFWDSSTGSTTETPIFIIGFVRSGSTLLERILDAHPQIAGTGENSVFNGRLDDIRNQLVAASNTGTPLGPLTRGLAEEVVGAMHERWEAVCQNTDREYHRPERLVDKMLTNYYNVGFIQMLYPKALILHVFREPMDSVFSAFKHEFPGGTLDYTSDREGLVELYRAYRDMMDHWDTVLPGRVLHIRYEDLVRDFEGTARAVIRATGLEFDPQVLEFHTQKQAVNTLSSTQVRKGVYTSSLKSWQKYERQLQGIVQGLGDRVRNDQATTLPGYKPLVKEDKEEL